MAGSSMYQMEQARTDAWIQVSGKEQVTNIDMDMITARRQGYWDLSGDFPRPKSMLKCAWCGNEGSLITRNWSPFKYMDGDHTSPYRINITLKCIYCSMTGRGGLVVSKTVYYEMLKKARQAADKWLQEQKNE